MGKSTNSSLSSMLRVFSIRDFFLLWASGTISIFGSQFSMIALPWLALQLTGDPLALGLVLALGGIPRAVILLIGGATSDRFSPRWILLICDWANFMLAGLVVLLIITGEMQIWMLYLLSLLTGLLSGFVYPAANAILPLIVPDDDLQAGNSIIQGSMQFVGFVGPMLAGIMIGATQSTLGMTIAFTIDAASFAISALALWAMRGGRRPQTAKTADENSSEESIWQSIRAGVYYLVGNDKLRFLFTLMMAINFLFVGPILVGIPVLAAQRLPEGAQAFGLLMSAFAGGSVVGLLLAGTLPKPNGRMLSVVVIGVYVAFGAVLISMGWITSTWVDFSLLLLLGIGNSYIGLSFFTWIQLHTPKDMLGRIMSIIMLGSMGLMPLSEMLAGAISKWNLTLLFVLAGDLTLLLALWAAFQPALKSLGHEMATPAADHLVAVDGLPHSD